MAKNIKWVLDRKEKAEYMKRDAIRLVWLQAGTLANYVIVERTGRGSRWQKAPTQVRVIATVMVLQVFNPDPKKGMSEILYNGQPLLVQNTQLRPLAEDE